MNLSDFSIGCDPELFLSKRGRLISAHETNINGTKSEPFKIKDGAVQIDGCALEFNTDPVPLNDFNAFNGKVINVMKGMRELVPGFNFKIQPTAVFDEEYWKTIPDENKELGCNPDYNAYTLKHNPAPDANAGTMRTGAGHLHLGWDPTASIPAEHPEHIEVCANITKMFDLFVGLGTLLFDDDTQRRSLYGRAGAFRPKPYGFEYRVPSNAWLTSISRRRFVHDCAKKAVQMATQGCTIEKFMYYYPRGVKPETRYIKEYGGYSPMNEELLAEVINESDVDFAKCNFNMLTGLNANVR